MTFWHAFAAVTAAYALGRALALELRHSPPLQHPELTRLLAQFVLALVAATALWLAFR